MIIRVKMEEAYFNSFNYERREKLRKENKDYMTFTYKSFMEEFKLNYDFKSEYNAFVYALGEMKSRHYEITNGTCVGYDKADYNKDMSEDKFNNGYDEFTSELICSGIQQCLELKIDTRDSGLMFLVSGDKSEYTLYTYLCGFKRLLRDVSNDKAKKKYHKSYYNERNDVIDLAYYLIDSLTLNFNGTDIRWFKLLEDINETIKSVNNNYYDKLKAQVISKSDIKIIYMVTKAVYKEYQKKLDIQAEEHARSWAEYRERCAEADRVREARMAAYDRACDRAGCALPYNAVL